MLEQKVRVTKQTFTIEYSIVRQYTSEIVDSDEFVIRLRQWRTVKAPNTMYYSLTKVVTFQGNHLQREDNNIIAQVRIYKELQVSLAGLAISKNMTVKEDRRTNQTVNCC